MYVGKTGPKHQAKNRSCPLGPQTGKSPPKEQVLPEKTDNSPPPQRVQL
jgi:hypothetical protein